MLVFAVAYIAGLLAAAAAAAARRGLRIIDGRDATPGELPFVVIMGDLITLIFANKTELVLPPRPGGCSGSAISPKWVLTAQHCCPNSHPVPERMSAKLNKDEYDESIYAEKTEPIVLYGFSQSEKKSYSIILKSTFLPKTRSEDNIDDDVALLHTEPMSIEHYAPVSAVHFTALYGRAVSAAGFGLMKETEHKLNYSPALNRPFQVTDRLMLRSCENDAFPSMCLVPACGERPMPVFGDSGGPVMDEGRVVGVFSRGTGFLMWNHPSMSRSNDIITITPVSPYINWVAKVIADHE